jgi:hypothetical protein
LVPLRRAEKRHPIRDHLHHLVPDAFAILILAVLYATLDRKKPFPVKKVCAAFRQTVEDDHGKPGHPFSSLAFSLPTVH